MRVKTEAIIFLFFAGRRFAGAFFRALKSFILLIKRLGYKPGKQLIAYNPPCKLF